MKHAAGVLMGHAGHPEHNGHQEQTWSLPWRPLCYSCPVWFRWGN